MRTEYDVTDVYTVAKPRITSNFHATDQEDPLVIMRTEYDVTDVVYTVAKPCITSHPVQYLMECSTLNEMEVTTRQRHILEPEE
ncbi:hypothetical protein J6590_022712 [Homalodisca vitripennis]|nr:hypothetical protein J6590_022712 [Homalodisca vitripennis]